MNAAWVDEGYTAPNTDVYPWLWLWDSCFHSLVWLALDNEERAVQELTVALSTTDAAGFVAHMGYQKHPERATELWGRPGASSITQPPMFGHTVAVLTSAGVAVPDRVLDQATAGLRFLLHDRARTDGLVEVVHPWETGCDDSPRWDALCPGDGFDIGRWKRHKNELIDSVERGSVGEPLHNPAFPVASIGFNALVAWNAQELASVTGDEELRTAADELVDAIEARFDPDLKTWVDAGPAAATSGRARTADSLLPLLVSSDEAHRRKAIAELLDEDAHGSAFGPRGVHAREPSYSPDTYWRGPVWPQLAYLLWVALDRGGPAEHDAAEVVRLTTIDGASVSGLAEYWNGDTGQGLGAIPQSWTGLALLLDVVD